jgi:uncharacterized membrane protein
MGFEDVESLVRAAVEWLRLLIETLGAAVIALGVLMALLELARGVLSRRGQGFIAVRLLLARYLTLALELQLAADILSTSIAPTWDRIGKLAAIAVIRTALNYFLEREIRTERVEAHRSGQPAHARRGAPAVVMRRRASRPRP